MSSGCFVLTPSESKRLIAKAVVQIPEVQVAKEKGRLIVANGTTNGYIVEELTGRKIAKEYFTAGVVAEGRHCVTDSADRLPPLVLENGTESERAWTDVLNDFEPGDVFIKGANAVDPEGNVGILVADRNGGTIGRAIGPLSARGCLLIVPVGLEKLVPCVHTAAEFMGITRHDISLGCGSGLMVVTQASVITEIDALELLFPVEAAVVSAGGIGGAEGSIGLAVQGSPDDVRDCLEFVRKIKGEPPLPSSKRKCRPDCNSHCHWISR